MKPTIKLPLHPTMPTRRQAKAILAVCIAAFALPTVALHAQNLVQNPDFSANAAAFKSYPGYFGGSNPASAPNWTTTGGGGINGTLTPSSDPFAPATNVPSFLFMQGDVTASQAINTVAGTDYLFSFDGANRNDGDKAGASVFADNTQAASVVLGGPGKGFFPKNAFHRYLFGFTATGPQTIQFTSSGVGGDHTTDITNVSVTATAGNQIVISDGTTFIHSAATAARNLSLTGNNQEIYHLEGSPNYTGNISTDGSGGTLSVVAYGVQNGNQSVTFSGNTIALGAKSFRTNGSNGGNVDSVADANSVLTTLDNVTLSTNANVQVTRSALHVTGTSQVNIGGQLLSSDAWGEFTIGGNASVTATGGVDFHINASHLVFDSGTLTTPFIWGNTYGNGLSRTIFNGTRIVASGDSGDFLKMSVNSINDDHGAAANIANGGANFDTDGHSVTIQNILADLPGSSGPLNKLGAGTLILSASNSYTGTTTVSAGTLLVNGSISGAVSVQSGGTLGGSGTVGAVSVLGGGIVAPGAAGVGTLNTGDFSLASTNVLKFELANPGIVGSGTNDLLSVTGALTLDGTLQVTELLNFGEGTYRLFDFTGGLTDNTLALEASFLLAHPGSYIDTATANQVNLMVVPEPGAAISLLGGLGLLLVLRRRRTGYAV